MRITGCCAKTTPAVAVADGCCAITSLFAAAGLTWKRLLQPDWPPLVAVNCLSPVRLMLRLLNVATPLALAVWVRVPLKVPLPEVKATVTEALGTPTPRVSVTVTCTAGEMMAPAVASAGWVVKVTVRPAWLPIAKSPNPVSPAIVVAVVVGVPLMVVAAHVSGEV